MEFSNLSEGRNAEKLVYTFFTKHKFGNQLIFMIMEMNSLNPEVVSKFKTYNKNVRLTEQEQADPLALFPMCAQILGVLRKGGVVEQLQCNYILWLNL